jgi:hypothetical protein
MNIAVRSRSLPILDTTNDRLEQQESRRSGMHAGLSESREWWVDEYQRERKKNTLVPRYGIILQENPMFFLFLEIIFIQ